MSQAQQMAALQALLQQAQARQQPSALVEFRAGILNLSGTTVTADPRRGTLRLVQSQDGLLRLQWLTRPGGNLDPQHDLILFPHDARWRHVPECTTGRVYLLSFASNARKRFFWMQEPSDDKDAEYAVKINEYINNPPAQGAGAQADGGGFGAGAAGAGGGGGGGANTQQQLLAQLLAGMGGGAAGAAAGGADQAAQLQQAAMMQNMAAAAARQSLVPIVDADRVLEVLDSSDMEELAEFLPEGQRSEADFAANLRSPQLRQTLARMSGMLNGSQFGTIMTSLGLNPTGGIGVDAFLDAIQTQYGSDDADDDGDDDGDDDDAESNDE